MWECCDNPGAREVVEVFQKWMAVEVCFAPPPMATHFLLYLAHETFVGEAGEKLAEEVRHPSLREDPWMVQEEPQQIRQSSQTGQSPHKRMFLR